MKRKSQQGVALVITVILLSVITFLAVAFLAISRREQGSVSTTIDQTTAQLAARTAFERAQAQIIAGILARTNEFAYGLMVATNYINPLGFNPALGANFTNVNYDYTTAGGKLTPAQFLQNVANLRYDPRPPVFITNRLLGTSDFRYYLDLNRNGRFEKTGWLPAVGRTGGFIHPDGSETTDPANGLTNYFTGDPQWVGDLARPDLPHSSVNRFIDRWTWIALPAGLTLDFNHIYNQVKMLNQSSDGFLRNEGVGTWELNLAACLRDLNTNAWTLPYVYNPVPGLLSDGPAFNDATALLRYRYSTAGPSYSGNYKNLASLSDYFGANPRIDALLATDRIDAYGSGPLMIGLDLPVAADNLAAPWPGSPNADHFFTTQDLFDQDKTRMLVSLPSGFTNRLYLAGTNVDSYDRTTFYRMLAAIGTDSGPEPPDRIYAAELQAASPPGVAVVAPPKINLNYANVGGLSATNFVDWHTNAILATAFFENAADRLLRDPNLAPVPGLSITNIPIWPPTNNFYTPAVHRLLQVTANIFDATAADPFPSLFRPIFTVSNGVVRITGYTNDNTLLTYTNPKRWMDRSALAASSDGVYPQTLVYGIPVVVGAKKGLPNFNEVALQSIVLATRNLVLQKRVRGGPIVATNQMYTIGVSNVVGVEAWNSYVTPYPRPLELDVQLNAQTTLRNANGVVVTQPFTTGVTTNFPAGTWAGYPSVNFTNSSFKIPLAGGYQGVPNSIYWPDASGGGSLENSTAGFQSSADGFPVPILSVGTTNRLRFLLIDRSANRIVDCVSLDGIDNTMDLSSILANRIIATDVSANGIGGVWLTNRVGGTTVMSPTAGIRQQIEVSLGNVDSAADWKSYMLNGPQGRDKEKAIDALRVFCGLTPMYFPQMINDNTNLALQAGFSPARRFTQRTSWQANDPLVHYTAWDLTDLRRTNEILYIVPPTPIRPEILMPNIGQINTRYHPWPTDPTVAVTDPNAFNLALKDPMVRDSDDWSFPTNKFPNLGFLGRVHRGTPWQTLYLKSSNVVDTAWQSWTGDGLGYTIGGTVISDASAMRPVSDWAILDHFTAALSDSATRGQLSINQTELPAWSAVLAGVPVLSNSVPDARFSSPFTQPAWSPVIVSPAGDAGLLSPVGRVWQGILRERSRRDLTGRFIHPDQTFWRVGDILSVPELTVASPFLNLSTIQQQRGLTDAAYERIPQMILSLLRGDDAPRFVVYAFGQTLKPDGRGIVTSGPFTGLCTNYQVMAEYATRTVVRVDNAPPPWPVLQAMPPAQRAKALQLARPRPVVESFNILPPD